MWQTLICSAPSGRESGVRSARIGLILGKMGFASPSTPSAAPGTLMTVSVSVATEDLPCSTEIVNNLRSTKALPLTWDADVGTGKPKSAWNAQLGGCSAWMESVLPYLTLADTMIMKVIVQRVTKGMSFS